jgi:hypothetical protein
MNSIDKMTFSNNDIVIQIKNDRSIDQAINRIVSKNHRDDFKQHFYHILLEYNNTDLNLVIKKDYLHQFLIRVIMNTNRKKSRFYKEFRNSGMPYSHKITEFNHTYNQVDEPYVEDDYEKNSRRLDEILAELFPNRNTNCPNSDNYYYTLFRLHREGKTYREIEQMTGIKYKTIFAAITKVKKDIQDKL